MSFSRRRFLESGAAAAAGIAFSRPVGAAPPLERLVAAIQRATRPVVVASANGIRGGRRAYDMIVRDGADTLDAIIAGVNIPELDPGDESVGLGGLPNEGGVVQLDA